MGISAMTEAQEIEWLRTELDRAYRALFAYVQVSERREASLSMSALLYHAPTIGAAKRWVIERAMDGADHFTGKHPQELQDALDLQ